MSNTNIQSPIPILGPGFTPKTYNKYKAGEYKLLVNAEIDDKLNAIVNRRNIARCGNTSAFLTTGGYGFIGEYRHTVAIASDTQQFFVGDALVQAAGWDATDLPVNAALDSSHEIVGFVEYGGVYYWITWEEDNSIVGNKYKTHIYYHDSNVSGNGPEDVIFADLSTVNVVARAAAERPLSFFMHKERLFIIFRTGIYYSKATDPTVWAVPDGGFIQEQYVNTAFPLSDSIYILTTTNIKMLTYASDIEADGYLRTVSETGATAGCVHNSEIYVLNDDGVHRLFNTGIEHVYDVDIMDEEHSNLSTYKKIISFDRYLVVLHRLKTATSGLWTWRTTSGSGVYGEYNLLLINTKNGAKHIVDFKDRINESDANRGFVVDVYNIEEDGEDKLYLTTATNPDLSPTTSWGAFYALLSENEVLSRVRDEVLVEEAGVKTELYYKSAITIEISNFTPDGHKHFVKKFRNFLIEGKFPSSDFKINFKFDGADWRATPMDLLDLWDGSSDLNSPPYSHRFPLMQRGKSMSIKLYTDNNNTALSSEYDTLEITDMRVIWHYIAKLNHLRNPGNV